jgi:GNAT superfamily N-acetyltransferase
MPDMAHDPFIRQAELSDATALAEFAARTFAESFAADTAPEDMRLFLAKTYSAEIQGEEIRNPRVTTLFIEVDAELAGFCQVRVSPPPPCLSGHDAARLLELGRFYVDQRWHGAGLAQRLMDAAFSAARARGANQMWLGVFERNSRAQKFYAKAGFVPVGHYVFQVGSDPQRDLILLAPVPAA